MIPSTEYDSLEWCQSKLLTTKTMKATIIIQRINEYSAGGMIFTIFSEVKKN